MDRAYLSNVGGTPPPAPAVPVIGFPQAGNPGVGQLATKPGAYWYHMVTEELRAIIVAAGLTPDAGDLDQVITALNQLFITPAELAATSATDTAKGLIEIATSAEVAAGTDTSRAVVSSALATVLNSRPGHTYGANDWAWLDKSRGLMVQWGAYNFASVPAGGWFDTTAFSLPTAYPNGQHFFCIPGVKDKALSAGLLSRTGSGFTANIENRSSGAQAGEFYIISIGR